MDEYPMFCSDVFGIGATSFASSEVSIWASDDNTSSALSWISFEIVVC